MRILVVDDSPVSLHYLGDMLNDEGFTEVVLSRSVQELLRSVPIDVAAPVCPLFDLILMDIHMPGINGIEACRHLKNIPCYQDIPVIVISGAEHLASLQSAFEAGAVDFLRKPPERIELLARVRSALNLKAETDRRKSRELELIDLAGRLEEANRELKRLSSLDGLTGMSNRLALTEFLDREWKRSARHGTPLAAILADVDCFKNYNDRYGHLEGDDCLKKVACAMASAIRRGEDLFARYGGEEFIALLPGTDLEGATRVAEAMRQRVFELRLPHGDSSAAAVVTVSIGVAACIGGADAGGESLVAVADAVLYEAKRHGRNCVVAHPSDSHLLPSF